MSEVINPHDGFFRETFSRKEIATSFLKEYLPAAIREQIDLETLSMSKDSFIDKELRHHFSDLLYTVQHKQGALHFYLLFEHKSSPDPWISLQLLRYMVRIWEQCRKQQPKARQLPVIIPLVLYHGRNKWQVPPDFQALLLQDQECFRQYTPDFRYLLHDFSLFSNEQIKGEAISRITLLVLKHIFDPELSDKLPAIIDLLRDVQSKNTALEILEILLRYVVKASQRFNEKDIRDILSSTAMEDEIMKTFIDEYIEQGMKQGMQQGMQQGQYKILSAQLNHRFGTLPDWVSKKIKNADVVSLEEWSLRLLSAKSLDEIFH